MGRLAKRKTKRPVQLVMWNGIPSEPVPRREETTEVLAFEGTDFTFNVQRDDTWIQAETICTFAGVLQSSQAVERLDDDEKRVFSIHTNRGPRKAWFVNEAGFYRLILSARLRKDHPRYEQIKRFRRWVTHEVLPEIRRTGTYRPKAQGRQAEVMKELGCDAETAKVRCEQYAVNLGENRRLASEGAKPHDLKNWHNAAYRGMCGMEASDLRRQMGLKSKKPPFQHMDKVPMVANLGSKILAGRIARNRSEAGQPMTLAEQAELIESVARETIHHHLRQIGDGAALALVDDPKRGRIRDVVQVQIAAS